MKTNTILCLRKADNAPRKRYVLTAFGIQQRGGWWTQAPGFRAHVRQASARESIKVGRSWSYALTIPTMLFTKSFSSLFALVSAAAHLSSTLAFPAHQSLAGLSERELESIIATLPQVTPGPLPPPPEYVGPKLVNDADHPWEPLRPGDIRGPCPGLNTLASHGVGISLRSVLFRILIFTVSSICRATEWRLPLKSLMQLWKVCSFMRTGITSRLIEFHRKASTSTTKAQSSSRTSLISSTETSSLIFSVLEERPI